jgi:hypothetical protein
MVERWRGVVQTAATGNTLGWDDFNNDVYVRSQIAVALADPALSRFTAMNTFAEQVSSLDDAFRALLLVGAARPGNDWWERGILARADSDYAEVARHFGAIVENNASRDIGER